MSILPRHKSPPEDAPFCDVLRAAMESGVGTELTNEPYIGTHSNTPWLVKQLAGVLFVRESTLSSWRTGRKVPSPHSASQIIDTLTGTGDARADWREALQQSYQRTISDKFNKLDALYKRLPAQSGRALKFIVEDQKVSFDSDNPHRNNLSDNFEFFYGEIKVEVSEFLKTVPARSNQLEELREAIVAYRSALGDRPTDLSRPDIWRLGRNLRKLRFADQRRSSINDIEDPPFSPNIIASLDSIVVLHNTLSSTDPILSDFDQRGSDPADRKLALGAADALVIVYDAAAEPEFIDPKVPEALLSLLERTDISRNDSTRDSVIGVDSTRNAIILIVSEAVRQTRAQTPETPKYADFQKGFWSASGKITAGAAAGGSAAMATVFIVKYGADIIKLTSKIPGGDVIEVIVSWIMNLAGQ